MSEAGRTVLITGSGLVGAHAAGALQAHGVRVVLYDLDPSFEYLETLIGPCDGRVFRGDICDVGRLTALAREHDVGCILHTAGLIGAQVSRQPLRGVEVNVAGTMAAMEAARQAGAARLVFCSSMAVYDFSRLPADAAITEDAPLGPQNLYGATKLAAEQLLDHCGKLHGLGVIHLRLAGVFGRGQYTGGSWMGRIVNRLLQQSLRGEPVALQPEWIGTNEFVYAKDVAAAAAAACLADGDVSGPFNIGTGALHSFAEVVSEMRRLLPMADITVSEPAGNIVSYLERSQPFDISRARSRLGFAPRFTLASGLADYVAELQTFAARYRTLD